MPANEKREPDLPEEEIRILQFLAGIGIYDRPVGATAIAGSTQMSREIAMHHLEKWRDREFVDAASLMGGAATWFLDRKGRP